MSIVIMIQHDQVHKFNNNNKQHNFPPKISLFCFVKSLSPHKNLIFKFLFFMACLLLLLQQQFYSLHSEKPNL